MNMKDCKTAYFGYHIYFSGPYIAKSERDLPGVLLISKSDLLRIRSAADATLKVYDEIGIDDDEAEKRNNQAIKVWEGKKLDTRSLYLIHNTIQNTLKIGISANPNQRLRALQVATSDYLTLIFSIKGKAYLEKELHNEFAELRLASEWFKYDKRIIERFNGLVHERMDKNI